MSRRTVLSAVTTGNGAFEAVGRRIPQHASRSFTSTAQRNATKITHFTPTSSAELDSALSTIREKILLPSYLTLAQRKKIISSKWAKKLQVDPITIEIDGELSKFRYMNPFSGDIPNTRKSVVAAVEKFDGASDDDFANLRPLLEGVHATGRRLSDDFYAKILRIVGLKGRVYELVELARGSKKTGFRLDTSEKVNELLHFCQLRALEAEWSRPETQKALRWAEEVVELLEDEAHAPKTAQIEGDLPLNRDPQVLLAPLHLAAALVVKAGVQEERLVAKVNRLSSTIVKLWPAGHGLKKLHPLERYVEDMDYLLDANKFVALATPLLHGLELASQAVSEPALAAELQSRSRTLKSEIESAISEAAKKSKNGRGEVVYQKFYGGESS
ncbi:hypothetical protein TruAng_010983 [Truncatella angustata]|nr:hypothetical protein TruAng_010983 [Truncatella angustata]